MKALAKRLARKLGFEIIKLDSAVEIDSAWGPNLLVYALNDLSQRNSDPLQIIQIGAHDGSDQDPLQVFLENRNCDAILVEPMDHPFAHLSERYANNPRIHTVQVAISDHPGTLEIYYITDGNGEADLTLYSSLDRHHVEGILATQKASRPQLAHHRIQAKCIECRTVKSLVDDFGMQRIDAIIVDAEGLDNRIVSGFLRDGVEPSIIRFEYCNLSRRDFSELCQLLREKNYEIARIGIDIYCQKLGLLR